MYQPGQGQSVAPDPDIPDSGDLSKSIRDQRARVRKLREDTANTTGYEIREAVDTLGSLLSKAIIPQFDRVRKLRTNRAGKSRIIEAERRLETLKAEFLADTGREWSDVREEGPVLLTTNKVRGSEALPELQAMTKDLRRENIVR